MLYKTVCFVSHCKIRIADQGFAVLFPGQPGQKIDLAVKKHLVQVRVAAINIFILPACIFGQLQVILVGISCFDRVFMSSFLEHFVLIIADLDYIFF